MYSLLYNSVTGATTAAMAHSFETDAPKQDVPSRHNTDSPQEEQLTEAERAQLRERARAFKKKHRTTFDLLAGNDISDSSGES